MAGVNEHGFPMPTNYQGGRIEKVSSLSIAHNVQLPDVAWDRLSYLMAHWLLETGQHRQVLSDCIGREARFHEKIRESYGGTWEAVKASPLADTTRRALDAELRSIQFDLKVDRRADEIYAADQGLSRSGLRVLGELATEEVRFVNRNARRSFVEAEPVKLERADKPDALIAALDAAAKRRRALQLCLPPEAEAWSLLAEELATRCKMPSVYIGERGTPDELFRATDRLLPPRTSVQVIWPERSSLHAIAPGNNLHLHQIDSLGVLLALHRDELAAHLRQELAQRYEAAKIDGYLVLTEHEQRQALSELASETLLIERKLSQLFWRELDGHKRVPEWMTAGLLSPPALLGIE